MKDSKYMENPISDARNNLYQLKKHLEDKRISDKKTLKLFKQIENSIMNLESYEKLYSDLGDETYKLSKNNSLSEIGEHVMKHFGG